MRHFRLVIWSKGVEEIEGLDRAASAEEKLTHLIDTYGTALLRMCYAYLKDVSLAEDATQDTLLKAYQRIEQFVPNEGWSEKAWLMRIAVNTCKDYLRSAWFRHVDRRAEPEPVMGASLLEQEQRMMLEDVLALSPKYREVLLLRYYHDLDIDEICHVLGLKRPAVYKRLERAHQRLRIRLERGDPDE